MKMRGRLLFLMGILAAQALPQEFDIDGILGVGCSEGLEFNTKLDKCVKQCPANQRYDDILDDCLDKCQSSEVYNANTGECERKECPRGEEFDDLVNECVLSRGSGDDCENEINVDDVIGSEDVDIRAVGDGCSTKKCEDYAHLGFRCVPLYICSNSTIVTDGKKLIDIRASDDNEGTCCTKDRGSIDLADHKCPGRKVCCQHPDYSKKRCGVNSKCSEEPETTSEYEKCGRVISTTDLTFIDSSTADEKLLDNSIVQPGQFPHMCLIYRVVDNVNTYIGGASMIDRNKFLTVAHKFLLKKSSGSVDIVGDSNIYVRCGEHDVKLDDDLLEFQESRVSKVHLHPDYNGRSLEHNIAILETELNMIYVNHISRVCLPEPGNTYEGMTDCYSTGWGSSARLEDDPNAYYSDILRKVQLSVVDRNKCSQTINSLDRLKGKVFRLYDSWMCIGGETGEDTCEGDGGSPHVCRINNKWVQVGAVAFGFGCGEGRPAIYSSVSDSMCFIDWVMTCVPLSSEDINHNSVNNVVSLKSGAGRDSETQASKNRLRNRDCRAWLDAHQNLKNQCDVRYLN